MFRGEAPVAKARLVHCSDGCVVTLTLSHALVDAQRCIEVCRDLGRAYRGVEIPARDFDRSGQWPDQLAKHYPFLGDEVANLPRAASTKKELSESPQCPEQSCSIEGLYLSEETVKKMKDIVKPYLSEGEFVSTNDLVFALNWMLRCEFTTEGDAASAEAGLPVSNTAAICSVEFLKNGIDLVPENYFGNASILPVVMNMGNALEGKPLEEIFARLALLMRKQVTDIRKQPIVAAQFIMAYYMVASTGTFPPGVEFMKALVSNLSSMPVSEVDFGGGSPKMAHLTTPYPINGFVTMCAPAPGSDKGLILHAQLTEEQLKRLKTSKVMATCAPDMRLLYADFSVSDLEALMKS